MRSSCATASRSKRPISSVSTAAVSHVKGSIEIEPPAGTKKACGEPDGVMEQEAAYLAALPTAVSYRLAGSVLELIDADGKRLVTYTSATG